MIRHCAQGERGGVRQQRRPRRDILLTRMAHMPFYICPLVKYTWLHRHPHHPHHPALPSLLFFSHPF